MTVRYRTAPLPGYPDRTRPTRKHDGPPYRFLFGLASDGVYTALPVTSQAVGSYPTIPPSPGNQRLPSSSFRNGFHWKPIPELAAPPYGRRLFLFYCTSLGVTSTGRYPAPCPVKPGLSSPSDQNHFYGATVCAAPWYFIMLFSFCKFFYHTLKQLPPINSRIMEFFGTFSQSAPRK